MKRVGFFPFFFFFSLWLQAQSIGSKVKFSAVDGNVYTGVVNEIQQDKYKVKYDGFDFEAWLSASQFVLVEMAVPQLSSGTVTLTTLENIFNFGKAKGWVKAVQQNAYDKFVAPLSPQAKQQLLLFVRQAKTPSAQYFVLASWVMLDENEKIQRFINDVNKYPEAFQQEKCLMGPGSAVIQQWQNTCSVASMQTFLGDLIPRYAWDLKMTPHFNEFADDPSNKNAAEQKDVIERYGAPAAVRGAIGNVKVIGINTILDDYLTPRLGVRFVAQPVDGPLADLFVKIRAQLDRGIDVPLLVGFVNGNGVRHFILVMKYRRAADGYQYLTYDPWDGLCDYVSEATIQQGSLAPLLPSWKISIDYYYPAN